MMINSYGHENKPEGFVFCSYSQLWITLLGIVVFISLRNSCKFLRPLIMSIVPTKGKVGEPISEEERVEISEKIEGHIFNATVYTISSVWGYMVCKDKDWYPWYLGGHGDPANGFINLPFVEDDQVVLFYGLFQFGFRIESLISHVIIAERGNDFEEMLLHDGLTCFLFFGFLFSNFLPGGTMIII